MSFTRKKLLNFLLILMPLLAPAQSKDKLVDKLLRSKPEWFGPVLENPGKYEVQIIYTQVDRDKGNQPRLTTHTWRVDPKTYFYPASTVKLPAVLLALEKLNGLNVPGLDKYTPLRIDSAYTRQIPVAEDSTAEKGRPSVAHYIKKILLVSDNDAFNRLLEFVGQRPFNESLYAKSFTNLKITRRLQVGSTPEEDRHSNPFTFYQGDKVVYHQPAVFNEQPFENTLTTIHKGKGYMKGDQLVSEPMDFSAVNYFSLTDMQAILRSLIFPEAVPAVQRFNVTEDDYGFVRKHMSMFPQESTWPGYDTSYYPSYGKFFLFGDTKAPFPPGIRIFNKAGWAYGTLTDNAYIVDFDRGVEFFLTATILVNEDGIFNDDKYEYETVGKPFLARLGQVIYEYELSRKRRHEPDLSALRFEYTH
jgi:hypothetical protein